MRYGIFGDIHSNLEAFQEVKKAYKNENIDRYICVGDIVGYGVDPHSCIEEVKKLKVKTVCGNHDRASAGLLSQDSFNKLAREAVRWTEGALSREEKEYLKSLTFVVNEENFSVVHGSLDMPDFFYYITDSVSAYWCFRKMEKDICFVGHSHVPVIFSMEEDEIKSSLEKSIKLKPRVRYIVNVGSVGQPRDGNPMASFSVFDSDRMTVEVKRVDYDVESAKNKILKAGLPERLGYRLLQGR